MTAAATFDTETTENTENTETQEHPTEQHLELREQIKELRSRVEESYWDLSVSLHEVFSKSIYLMWGFNTWQEYVENELDIALRKSQYLLGIQEWFGKMKPNIQQWIRDLGWSKAKELVGIVTPETAAQWKKKLSGKSTNQIIEIIREHKKKGRETQAPAEGEESTRPVRKSFTFSASQAENVSAAIQKAKEAGETDKDGNALDLICTDYMAQNQGIDSIEQYLAKIEKSIGVQLIAYHEGDNAVVYGYELCEKLAESFPTSDEEADGEATTEAE